MIRPLALSIVLALGALSAGCAGGPPPQRYFRITSYPQGATVYVNGEPVGTTDVARLRVDFEEDPLVNLRLQKDGYQPTGIVLSPGSPGELAFFLEEAPHNSRILSVLTAIRDKLDEISNQLQKGLE